ncbi:hypothetical protein CCB80_03450 [Armatimonadetes bacterium Uphvl-Ar1]|nr:hypothetical protein CCB80_03450 [Armatimonadetes bacterium Uphvl-Ar1]
MTLVQTLETRFLANPYRHPTLTWPQVEQKLTPQALTTLQLMEKTGGEPDLITHNPETNEITFADCSSESPTGRRSLCYDHPALEKRKANKPANSAQNLATQIGIQLLTEADYHHLQTLGEFDLKTSSWLQTPPEVRALGGAIFGDRRFNRVFIYHNGADSYYAARGFRGKIIL